MLIQKIFHVHHSLAETKAALARPQAFQRYLEGVNKAVVSAEGVAQFECEIAAGKSLHAVLIELPTEDQNQVLFCSTAGNVELSGLVEYCEIRPGVTEVQLTLEYVPQSIVARMAEFCGHRIERYLERQLRALQACLDGALSHSPTAQAAARYMGTLPQFAH